MMKNGLLQGRGRGNQVSQHAAIESAAEAPPGWGTYCALLIAVARRELSGLQFVQRPVNVNRKHKAL